MLHEGAGIDDTQRAYKTHNLFFLIDWIERESGFIVPDSLKEMADEITDWEAGSRYGESSVAEKNTIQAAIDIYEELKISAVAYVNGTLFLFPAVSGTPQGPSFAHHLSDFQPGITKASLSEYPHWLYLTAYTTTPFVPTSSLILPFRQS